MSDLRSSRDLPPPNISGSVCEFLRNFYARRRHQSPTHAVACRPCTAISRVMSPTLFRLLRRSPTLNTIALSPSLSLLLSLLAIPLPLPLLDIRVSISSELRLLNFAIHQSRFFQFYSMRHSRHAFSFSRSIFSWASLLLCSSRPERSSSDSGSFCASTWLSYQVSGLYLDLDAPAAVRGSGVRLSDVGPGPTS